MRRRRERESHPLILTGHGLSIRVDKSCLLIRDGNTHYPAERREWRFFKGSLDLPPRIILIDGSGSISVDALDWIAEQEIALVRIKFDGSNTIAFSPLGYAADPRKAAWQRATRDDRAKQLAFSREVIRDKLAASIETLDEFVPNSPSRTKAMNVARECMLEVRTAPNLSVLLATEGKAAQNYWRAWQAIELKWKAQSRYPVPDEWRRFAARSSVLSGMKHKNWKASNPVNAMLNYAYAVLFSQMKIRAIAEGYDPAIGILHDQRHKRKEFAPSFALDLMEPLRPVVDRAVLKLVREETFSGADFVLQSDGVCRLNPELARRVATASVASTW